MLVPAVDALVEAHAKANAMIDQAALTTSIAGIASLALVIVYLVLCVAPARPAVHGAVEQETDH